MTSGHSREDGEEGRGLQSDEGRRDWYWKRYTELYPKYFWAEDTKLADIVVASRRAPSCTTSRQEYIDLTSQWATNNLGTSIRRS